MTQEEIRKNAPDGATHYSPDHCLYSTYYFKVNGDDVFIWQVEKRWSKTIRQFNDYSELKPL